MGQTSDQDLQTRLRVIRAIEGENQDAIDATTARNILHGDLGIFDDELTTYNLDQATRDRLLAHARQDAAHALISVIKLSREVRSLKRMIMMAILLLLAVEALFFFLKV